MNVNETIFLHYSRVLLLFVPRVHVPIFFTILHVNPDILSRTQ